MKKIHLSQLKNDTLKYIFLVLMFCASLFSTAQTTETFSTPGTTTWTVPPCVTSITVQVWGGGGGGGGSISILRNSSDGEACSGAGGGGGGGYTSQTFAVTSGQVYNVVVGAGGTAGTPGVGTWNGGITTAPGNGGTGGTSSFINFGINLVATGGVGGNGAGAYNNNNPPDVNAIGAFGIGGVGSGGTVFYNGGNGAAGYILWTGTDKSGGGGGAAGPGGPGGNAPAGNSYGIIDNNPGGLGSAPGGTGGNSRMNNLPSNASKNGGNGNLIGAGGGGGLNHKDGYGAVSASGGAGARGEVRITYSLPLLPATPTLNTTAATCSSSGSSTITNYNAGYTYNFTPAGPTVGAGGVISGMVTGTNYTVTANDGSCNSNSSVTFSNAPALTTPTTPTLNTTAPTCSSAGTSTITNYNAGLTYNFTPAGPTVGAGGIISGMTTGTTYQVTASNGSCSSTNSVDFSNSAILPTPTTPILNSTAATCSTAGSSTISNYNAGYTYNFTPAGPTVGAGGVISGMVTGTNYTVTANDGSCNSSATAAFNNADILPSPIVTASSTAVCENGVITLTPTTGGTWVSNNTGVATVTAGGVVTIVNNGSVDFTFTATNTCTATTPAVLVNPEDNSSFSYTSNTHCLTGTDPIATVSGTPGGTFTITSPGVINATTGEIDLSASGIGSFTVYYNTASAGNPCPSIDSVIINITTAPSADFSYNVAQSCQDATAPILSFGVGASAGVFTSTPAGLSLNTSNGAITLSTSTPGVYTVYNTIAASGGCASAIDSTTIEVLQLDDATFNFATGGTYCLTGTDPIATLTGTAGGTFTISSPGVINSTTGEIDLDASGLGSYTVYYNTPSGNACPQIDSTTISIVDAPGASFTYATPFCQDNGTALPTFSGNNFAGTFSEATGGVVFLSTTTGELDLATSTPGTYTIYNNLAASGGCAAAIDSFVITINPSFNIQETVSMCSGGSYTFPDGTTQTNITALVVYNSNLTTTSGCDSIIETTVNVNPTYFNQESTNICSGGSYTFPDGTTQTNITAQVIYNSNLTTTLGCDSIVETTVIVDPQLSITADPVTPICFGENLTLTATGSGNGTVTWYSDAAGTNVIGTGSPLDATSQVSTTGIHTFYVNEAGTCASALTAVNVIVGGVTASIAATPTTGFMPLDVVFSNNSSTGPTVTYNWNFGDGTPTSNSSEPTHTYTDLGNYVATLIVSDGVCSDTATVTIEVIGQSTIIIPNVFTPNGDGSNDVFTVEGTNLKSVEGEIFNRWGQKLYEWKGVRGYWDGRTKAGTECPDGTYFYIIQAEGNDGEKYAKTGAFTLIR